MSLFPQKEPQDSDSKSNENDNNKKKTEDTNNNSATPAYSASKSLMINNNNNNNENTNHHAVKERQVPVSQPSKLSLGLKSIKKENGHDPHTPSAKIFADDVAISKQVDSVLNNNLNDDELLGSSSDNNKRKASVLSHKLHPLLHQIKKLQHLQL
ncbi:unnamed protein product [[Candida] boidinii]|nr:unnamed protein product [[Candida] boidinii]